MSSSHKSGYTTTRPASTSTYSRKTYSTARRHYTDSHATMSRCYTEARCFTETTTSSSRDYSITKPSNRTFTPDSDSTSSPHGNNWTTYFASSCNYNEIIHSYTSMSYGYLVSYLAKSLAARCYQPSTWITYTSAFATASFDTASSRDSTYPTSNGDRNLALHASRSTTARR